VAIPYFNSEKLGRISRDWCARILGKARVVFEGMNALNEQERTLVGIGIRLLY